MDYKPAISGNDSDIPRLHFDISYSLWVVEPTTGQSQHVVPALPTGLTVFTKDLPFERFKCGIFRHLKSILRDANVLKLLKSADSLKMVEWRCSLSNPHNQLFDPQKRFFVSGDASFKAFLAAEEVTRNRRSGSSDRPKLEIIMTKPESTPATQDEATTPLNTTSETTGTRANITQESAPSSAEAQASTSGPSSGAMAAPSRPSLFSSSDPSSRPPKRPRPNQEAPARLDPDTLEMEEFLKLCHIPLHDQHTRALITIHRLHHWSVFNYLSVEELKTVGFSLGPALLIHAGVTLVNRRVAVEAANAALAASSSSS
ncbi:uncharacterized protein PGTG_16429 [Puccinia graminis f. sp. tritici CRL 75-36-700-3]|uniref:SAM domain-containing protein n=1 Tax=Puccinia graminis f. sp. tritici (strain CRL 75-36-700-3 / race SCCL) TaxID=418459 RepID=E3L3W3_PUCGT|nr:uncharacterized protein PGTG_16429 [Puccinia graminis f. sp. tritici CRL 75-36-700-3]EFP91238.2 hypothetical protein PGTG_16429 [Puccinia graminis f. sp. tritici CRL 75-36-700-3]